MRICRLDLLRYGRFTDVTLQLPTHEPDFHVVFGPNEAGKSTALSALEDFLFGIPHNSPLNFLHEYGSMRVGAALWKDGETLEARRRKGNKETLLTPEEVPFPAGDGALAKFLDGADLSFFSRMFSLDHERLRQGGREILEARDEVGRMLFSAGAGIGGLRDRLKALEEEADALWSPRRAARRKYYQAEDRLKTAESALREHTVTAGRWQELKRAYDAAQEAYAALEQEIERKSTELRKFNRIRRVHRSVRGKYELDAGIAALGNVAPLPEDARQRLEEAGRDDGHAAARMETLAEQLEAVQKERSALVCDEGLLLRAEDIRQLHERRIQVRNGKADLPKRRAELESAEAALRRLAGELEWETGHVDRLVSSIPARSRVAEVRSLLARCGEMDSDAKAARAALEEAEARVKETTQRMAGLGQRVDVSMLAAAIQAARARGDIASRINGVESEIQDLQAAVSRQLGYLKPGVPDEKTLTSVHVPPRESVQTHRDACRDLDRRLQVCRNSIRTTEQELAGDRTARETIARDERVVPPEELAGVREHRDFGWSLIRRRYVEGGSISEAECHAFSETERDLPDAYEAVVRQADELSDQRFDKAEAAARLTEISRRIAGEESLLEGLRTEEQALAAESEAMNAAWEAMWAEAPFSPLSPDDMLEWLTTRTEILDLLERRAEAEHKVAALRRDRAETRDSLLAQLGSLGLRPSSFADQPLQVIVEAASDVQRRHEQSDEIRKQLAGELRKARIDAERKTKVMERTGAARSEWRIQLADSLSSLGLRTVRTPEAVAAQLDAMDEMREVAVRVNELRCERIGKIERDITAFNRDVGVLVMAVAADLEKVEGEDAVLEMERRLEDAKRTREAQTARDAAIASFGEKIEECRESRRKAREVIGRLQEIAGVNSIAELKDAVDKSETLRGLQVELARVTLTLNEEGDGLSVAELWDECHLADLDRIAVREEALLQELAELREHLMDARERRSETRQAFEAIGGDDASARDAAKRQSALAEMKEIAEGYVRARSAAVLLQWAIDRYRREKQAPLLNRAGRLFATLTGGSFSDLRLDFDDQDHVRLIGIRSDASKVGVHGMSTGTADQLYLALRVASVEDYLERADPLPFLADDLFINFDDSRAAAGLGVLGQLARKTQVLFFTHHRHLVDLARTTLGPSVSVVSLS